MWLYFTVLCDWVVIVMCPECLTNSSYLFPGVSGRVFVYLFPGVWGTVFYSCLEGNLQYLSAHWCYRIWDLQSLNSSLVTMLLSLSIDSFDTVFIWFLDDWFTGEFPFPGNELQYVLVLQWLNYCILSPMPGLY